MKKKLQKHKGKKWIVAVPVGLVVLVVFLAARCGGRDTGAVVTTISAVRGDLQESVSTSGTVVSGQEKVIFSPVGGTLAQVNVAAGDAVKAGDFLIGYDTREAEVNFRQAQLQQDKSEANYNGVMSDNSKNQAKLSEANTNLKVLNQQIADYEAAIKNLKKEKEESIRGTSNSLASQSRDLENQLQVLTNELDALTAGSADYAAKLQEIQNIKEQVNNNAYLQSITNSSDYVAQLDAQIADYQEQLDNCIEYKQEMESQKSASEPGVLDSNDRQGYAADWDMAQITYEMAKEDYEAASRGIYAEFDGIITECAAKEGAVVGDGAQLLTIESSNDIKVTFQAGKTDVEKLAVGQAVNITIMGNSYTGTVSKINRMAETNASGTPMVGVEVHIENPDDRIILGMDAKLEVLTRRAENALLIPVEVVNADKDGDFLYVVEDGKVVRKPILCGITSDSYTEVLEGITEEDQIIQRSLTGEVIEGMAVTAIPGQQ